MTTYRTGNHWGVTIVREGEGYPAAILDDCAFCCVSNSGCPTHPAVEDQLVAVVVNGDQALAERICALLNADQDLGAQLRDEARAAARVVTPTRRLKQCVDSWPDAETGDYDPRCCRFPKSCSATVYNPDQVTEADLEPSRDAPSGPLSSPVSAEQPPVGGGGRPEPQRRSQAAGYAPPPSVGPGCICNDPPPTVDKPKNGTASRPPGWACPRHGTVI